MNEIYSFLTTVHALYLCIYEQPAFCHLDSHGEILGLEFCFWVLKTLSDSSRDGCIIKIAIIMLFERPNVRVHNDPLIMCLSREAAGHDLTGRH